MSYTTIYARNNYSELCQSKEGFYFARFESYYNGHKSWGKWLPVRSFERNELGHVIAYTKSGEPDVYTVTEEKEVNYRLPKNGGLIDTLPDYYAKNGLIMIEDKYCEEYGAYEVVHVGYKGVRYSLSNRYQTKICYRYKSPEELVAMVLKAKGIIGNHKQGGGQCMKTVKIKKPWFELIASMSVNDIANSYYGSCNLTANFLNDYSEKAINGFADDFLESLDNGDLFFDCFERREALDNPDIILQYAANSLVSYFDYLKLADNPENLLKSEWIGEDGDKLVILKSVDHIYIVNTTEKPENAFNDVVDSLPSYIDVDNLAPDIVAVIEGEC